MHFLPPHKHLRFKNTGSVVEIVEEMWYNHINRIQRTGEITA